MTKPQRFILTTDYATLKNDATGTISVTLPSSASIGAASTSSWTTALTIGESGSSFRARITSSAGGGSFVGNSVVYISTSGASLSGSSIGFDLYIAVHRTSSTELSLTAFIPNPYGSTLTINNLSRTITASVATFLPPHA